MKHKNNVISIISYFFVVLFFVGIIGIASYFTNGFTSDFKTFYIKVNGETLLEDTRGYTTSNVSAMEIDVKYVFGKFSNEQRGYTFTIAANTATDKDFTFTVDGEAHRFSEETDLTKGFFVEQSDEALVITPKGNVADILGYVYEGKEIGDCEIKDYADMFVVTIYSYNGESQISVYFSVPKTVSDVTLDKEEIVF